jgi:hypothetical protein
LSAEAKALGASLIQVMERVFAAGSTELQDCRRNAEMRLIAVVPVPRNDVSGTENIERYL